MLVVSGGAALDMKEQYLYPSPAGSNYFVGGYCQNQWCNVKFFVPNGSAPGQYYFYWAAGNNQAIITVNSSGQSDHTADNPVVMVWGNKGHSPVASYSKTMYISRPVAGTGHNEDGIVLETFSVTLQQDMWGQPVGTDSFPQQADAWYNAQGPTTPDQGATVSVTVKGKYFKSDDILETIELKEDSAYNVIKSVKGVKLGSAAGTYKDLAASDLMSGHPKSYWIGKTVEVSIGGFFLQDYVLSAIDFNASNQAILIFDAGNIGDPGAPKPPTAPTTPRPSGTPDPTTVPGSPNPSPSTPAPANPTAAPPPSNIAPGAGNPSATPRPALPTASGGDPTGASMYAAFSNALKDEGDRSVQPGVTHTAPDDMTTATQKRGDIDKVQTTLNNAQYDVQTSKSGLGTKITAAADMTWVPTSGLGSVSGINFGTVNIMGKTASLLVDFTPLSGMIAAIRAAILFATAIAFTVLTVRMFREYL